MLTDEELNAIRDRYKAATPGPWEFEGGTLYNAEARALLKAIWAAPKGDPLYDADEPEPLVFSAPGWWPNGEADRAFIAHAREDMPALVAEVQRLRGALREIDSLRLDQIGVRLARQTIREALGQSEISK